MVISTSQMKLICPVRSSITRILWYLTRFIVNHDKPTFILRYPWGDGINQFMNVMSIPPPRDATIKNCTVVEYVGKNDGSGKWSCALDTMSDCMHITIARRSLQQHIQKDMNAKDMNPTPHVEGK